VAVSKAAAGTRRVSPRCWTRAAVEVLLLADLLTTQALSPQVAAATANANGIAAAVDPRRLGLPTGRNAALGISAHTGCEASWRGCLGGGAVHVQRVALSGGELSLVRRMTTAGFVIEPLPNAFVHPTTASFWIGPRVAITSLALPAAGARGVAEPI